MINCRLTAMILVLVAVVNLNAAGPNLESLSGWPSYIEINLPEAVKPGLCDLLATPSIYTRASRSDLLDLRLYDSAGREVPFALRQRMPRSEYQAFAPKEFNRTKNPDGSASVSLDLGANVEEHNRLEISTEGTDYRRAVRIEGSDDGTNWSEIAKTELRYFTGNGQVFDLRAVSYASSRFRNLKVTVSPDKANPAERLGDIQVRVSREVRDAGIESSWPAEISNRQPGRFNEGYTSEWTIKLPNGDKAPWETLEFDTEEKEFSRAFRLEDASGDAPWPLLTSGQWERGPGRPITPLMIKIPQRTLASTLKLIVIDQRNTPLKLRLNSAKASADQLLFQYSTEINAPLKLYLGNPTAVDPGYDIGKTLPKNPTAIQRATIGQVQQNNDYQPPPDTRSFLDRKPWATNAIFGIIVAALAGLLAITAKQAIRRYDAKSVSENSEATTAAESD